MLLTVLIFSISLGISRSQIPPGCDVTTTTGYRYSNFHHLHSNPDGTMELRFRVMAKSDAHIALTTSPLVLNPLYEIVIGASGNNYTDLRRTMTGRSVSAVKTPNLLSDSEFRGFWIVVRQGEIEVGKEGETLPYFHWKDNDPLPVHYYSLSSWTNTVAKWIQKCNFSGPTSWLSGNDNSTEDGTPPVAQLTENYFSLEDKLRMNLLQTYNKDTRPSSYHQDPVEVSVGLDLLHFELLASRVEVQVWFRLAWRDSRLQWNLTDYDNITVLHIPSHAIWQPDLSLVNNANAGDFVHFGETSAHVYPDGAVVHVPPSSLAALCDLDLRYWPYDTQKCELKFISWTHSGNTLNVTVNGEFTSTSHNDLMLANHEWKIVDFSARDRIRFFDDIPYPEAIFTLTILRNSPIYKATVIIPSIVIVLLTVVSFVLPPNSSERIYIGLVDMVLVVLYLIYLSVVLPALGEHMPLVMYFYSYTLIMITVSVVINIIALTLNRMPLTCRPPDWILNIVLGRVGYILGLSIFIPFSGKRLTGSDMEHQASSYTLQSDREMNDSHAVLAVDSQKSFYADSSRRHDQTHMEWLLVTIAFDRIALVLFTIVFAILMAGFL